MAYPYIGWHYEEGLGSKEDAEVAFKYHMSSAKRREPERNSPPGVIFDPLASFLCVPYPFLSVFSSGKRINGYGKQRSDERASNIYTNGRISDIPGGEGSWDSVSKKESSEHMKAAAEGSVECSGRSA